MKIGLEIKNPKRAIKPHNGDVILYDGKQWYVTTKEELFYELESKLKNKEKELDNKIAECDKKINEMNELKKKNAEQILNIAAIVQKLVEGGK